MMIHSTRKNFTILLFIWMGFFPICFSCQAFGFSLFYGNRPAWKPKSESDRDKPKYKTLHGNFSIKVLDLKIHSSPKGLSPLSKLKWYQNRGQWKECVNTAEQITGDHSLGVWVPFTHLTCMTHWYKTTRGLKVSFILNSFEKLETEKSLLLNSDFSEHRKNFINSFLDICELASKHTPHNLHSLMEPNRDIADFMDPKQRERYRNLLSFLSSRPPIGEGKIPPKTFYENSEVEGPVHEEKKKQVKKPPSKLETRSWIRFSRAFRKGRRLKAVKLATRFLSRFPESGKVTSVRLKTYKMYKKLFRRSGKKWKSLQRNFEKHLFTAPVEDLLFWANRSYTQDYYGISLGLAESASLSVCRSHKFSNGTVESSTVKLHGECGAREQTDKIPEALILAGRSAYNISDFQKARSHFQTLIEKYGEHNLSHEAGYLLGLLHYRQGNHEKVISIYEPFLKNPGSDPWELQIRYWLWRSFKKTNSIKAKPMAGAILREFPLTYYGLIVRQHEKNSLQSLISSETESLAAVSWETRGTEKQWERIKKLLELGWINEARQEINLLPEPEQASGLIVRSLLWHAASLFHQFIRDYASAIDRDHRYISDNLLKMIFFESHKEFVVRAEKEFSISRYLIWSIIRQESAFMPQAVSPSKAYGLMQIQAPTARETARWLKVRGFRTPRDIFKPEYNIRFGTHYFLRMLRKYKRVPPLAIAAYNVGPGNLDRWLRHRKDLKDWDKLGENPDNDLWMDELPWSETSFYVKAVLRNYLIYGVIHSKNDGLSTPSWLDMTTVVSEKPQ